MHIGPRTHSEEVELWHFFPFGDLYTRHLRSHVTDAQILKHRKITLDVRLFLSLVRVGRSWLGAGN